MMVDRMPDCMFDASGPLSTVIATTDWRVLVWAATLSYRGRIRGRWSHAAVHSSDRGSAVAQSQKTFRRPVTLQRHLEKTNRGRHHHAKCRHVDPVKGREVMR